MIEIPFNQYYIEEIKYRINDTKSVILKLHNWMIKDIEIVETAKKEDSDKVECVEIPQDKALIRDLINKSKDLIVPDIEKKKQDAKKISGVLEEYSPKKKSLEIIKNDAEKDSAIISERTKNADNDAFHRLDPNDELSGIKTMNELYVKLEGDGE